ncbi:MFS transporter [Pedomonas mirosovicensis]|uniref:MFS transporter n=1 Tax=Pedomonas mirosovicensis TaxID=2908641 RepID=UPI00216845ED|nr:MFS transporter [Pedomonas mirosovicensis]MCH8685774.1 MFS transporter [Pedomonas mirosovicensis]
MPIGSDRRQAAFLLFMVLAVVSAGNNALASVLPAIGRQVGIGDVLIAMVFSLSALLWAFSAPFWARQSDRYGRKRLIQLGVAGFLVSGVAFGCVVLAGLRGWLTPLATIAGFILTRALFGLMGSASTPAAQAYIAAETSREERTGALATLSSAFGLGTIIGPAAAPFFILPFLGLSGPIFVFVALAGVMLFIISRFLPADRPVAGEHPSGPVARSSGNALLDARIRPYLVYGFLAGSVQAGVTQSLGFFIIDLTGRAPQSAQQLIGVAMMAGAAATLLAQWGLIRLLRLRPPALMRWGAVLAAGGCLILAAAGTFGTLVTGFSLACLGFGFARPGFTAAASLAVPLEEQGRIAGAVAAINGACFILAPAVGVGLYQLGQAAPYALGALMMAAMVAYATPRRMRGHAYDVQP